jgi:ParB-like chromosome segregation protein Spo0J
MEKLKASITEDPELMEARPLIVNQKMEVIAGNQRWRACVQLGWEEVPCVVVDWDEKKQKRVMIKDNISAGEWDWDILANEEDPEELQEWGLDIPFEAPSEEEPAEQPQEPKQCKHCEKMIP